MRSRRRNLFMGSVTSFLVIAVAACSSGTGGSPGQASAAGEVVAAGSSSGPAANGACKLPANFKAGIASREILGDVNRDIISGATETFKAAGATNVNVTDAGGDPRKQNDN